MKRHDMVKILILLRAMQGEPKNLMRLHRELKNHEGFRDCHSVHRHLRVCMDFGFIEVAKVNKKWGLPTKLLRLTQKGEEYLRICDSKEVLDTKVVTT